MIMQNSVSCDLLLLLTLIGGVTWQLCINSIWLIIIIIVVGIDKKQQKIETIAKTLHIWVF